MKVLNNNIKAVFEIYKETLNEILNADIIKRHPELFAQLIELNNKHLIENLDKSLVMFKEENK